MAKSKLTADEVRALLAELEAEEAAAAGPQGPTAAFVADLADDRINPRALRAFVDAVGRAFNKLGVDLDAPEEEAADEPTSPEPVSPASSSETPDGAKVEGGE